MAERASSASPWWYRRRGALIGAVYFFGFALGFQSWGGPTPEPAWIVFGRGWGGGHGATILAWSAVASALVAWLLRMWGTAYLRREVVFAADVRHDRLIVAGPFRYVRNPLYLGNLFLALAVALLAPPVGFAIILIGNTIMVGCLAAEEARELERRYGATFEAYRRAVPAFVPRFSPAEISGSMTVAPVFRWALLAESFALIMALALVPVAIFGRPGLPAFYGIWLLGLPAYVALNWSSDRRDSSGKGR